MIIGISGAAGFIGHHLKKRLKSKGHQVIGIDNFQWSTVEDSEVEEMDVRNRLEIDRLIQQVDVVCHLAAQISVDKSIANPQETIDINVNGTLNVLEACVKHKKKLVFASSSEIYGTSQSGFMSESHPLDAQSVYGASKIMGDRLCKAYYDTYGLDVSILRSFNTFGPGQRMDSYGGVIAIFTDRVLKGLPPRIYGTGEQKRDYIWIEDALSGYELAISTDLKGKPMNIASGISYSVNDIAKMICEKINPSIKPQHIEERKGEVQELKGDISFAQSLGFRLKTDFEKNLQEYINIEKQNYV